MPIALQKATLFPSCLCVSLLGAPLRNVVEALEVGADPLHSGASGQDDLPVSLLDNRRPAVGMDPPTLERAASEESFQEDGDFLDFAAGGDGHHEELRASDALDQARMDMVSTPRDMRDLLFDRREFARAGRSSPSAGSSSGAS
jgi:hypothetical protein